MVATDANASALPILGFAEPVFAAGRNTSVRRGTRWLGVPRVRLQLTDGRLSAALCSTRTSCPRVVSAASSAATSIS